MDARGAKRPREAHISATSLRCLVKSLKAMPEASVFLLPVSLEEVPTYTRYIKMPMDLDTIWKKLKRQGYSTLAQARVYPCRPLRILQLSVPPPCEHTSMPDAACTFHALLHGCRFLPTST